MRLNLSPVRQNAETLLATLRFGMVGAVATAIHMGVAWSLIALGNADPLLSNLIAFLLAFAFSFAGHHRWTFRSRRAWTSALPRFFAIALSAFLANNVVLVTLLDLELMPASTAAVVAVGVMPVVTYLAARFWAFRADDDQRGH